MGVATILIILCHMPAHGVAMPDGMRAVIVHGGAGCDMFLFLSGLGMYYSLHAKKKVGGGNLISWYKKRYTRILVPYLLICAPLFGFIAIRDHWTIGQYVLRLSTISFWSEGWGLWFMALIIMIYLVTPLLDKLLNKQNKWFWVVLLLLLTWLSGSIFVPKGIFSNFNFCFCRVPSYLLGYGLASLIIAEKHVKIFPILIVTLCLYALSQIINKTTSLSVSVFWLEGIILLIISVYLIKKTNKISSLKVLNFIGTISLESYCTNVFLLSFFYYIPWQLCCENLNLNNWTYYTIGTIACILVSWIVNEISKRILYRI